MPHIHSSVIQIVRLLNLNDKYKRLGVVIYLFFSKFSITSIHAQFVLCYCVSLLERPLHESPMDYTDVLIYNRQFLF